METQNTMASDAILYGLEHMKIVKVESVFSPSSVQSLWPEVTSSSIQSCLWPRVTFQLGSRTKRVSMKELIKLQSKQKINEKTIWQREVVIFAGGNRHTTCQGRRKLAMDKAANILRDKVNQALWRAAQTQKIEAKVRKIWLKKRKNAFQEAFTKFLQVTPTWKQVRPQDLVQMFEAYRNLEAVKHVLET